jgi:hypothetical protein
MSARYAERLLADAMSTRRRSGRLTAQSRCKAVQTISLKGAGMTWEFITRPVRSVNAVSWEWEWRYTAEDGSKNCSARTFASFRECIADARLRGFTGDPDPSESGTFFQRPEARFNWY